MKLYELMPETEKLWREIQQATDTIKLNAKKIDLERKKQCLLRDKSLAKNLTEFTEVEQKIEEVEKKILKVERELEVAKFTALDVQENILPKLKDIYNAEFKKYKKEHEKLYTELEKELKEFYCKVEPIVSRIDEIEKFESSIRMMQKFGPPGTNEEDEYLKLNRRVFTFNRPYNFRNGISREFIPSLQQVLRVLKTKI